MERQSDKTFAGVKNWQLQRKVTKGKQKSIHMELPGQARERINLFPLLLSKSQDILWSIKFFLNYGEGIKRRFFIHNINHPQSQQEGFSISEEK